MNISELKKKLVIFDQKSYETLIEIMSSHDNYKEDDVAEATFAVFINAYLFGDILTGKRALEMLLPKVKENAYVKFYTNIIANAGYYIAPLTPHIIHNLRTRTSKNTDNFNPFLFRDIKTNDYVVGVRLITKGTTKGGYEIFVYSQNHKFKNCYPLTYNFNYKKYPRLYAQGTIEDIRVIHFSPPQEDKFLGVGTTMDTHPEGIIRMSMFTIYATRNEEGSIIGLQAKDLIPLRGYEDDQRQKNWLPFFQNNVLHFIYKQDPIVILKANEQGSVSKIYTDKRPLLSKMRGNTPPIIYNDKLLFIVHCMESKNKIYYHRFVEMDKDFTLNRISCLFYFERCNTVEFPVNMIPDKNDFLISYGVRDRVARVSRVTRQRIEELFTERKNLLM